MRRTAPIFYFGYNFIPMIGSIMRTAAPLVRNTVAQINTKASVSFLCGRKR